MADGERMLIYVADRNRTGWDGEFDHSTYAEWAGDRCAASWAEARAKVGWRAQWRFKSGRLMPIPGVAS